MSSNDTWAKLGGGTERKRVAPEDTLHAVGTTAPNTINDPMGTPFLDTAWERTVPNALASQKFDMGDVVLHGRSGRLYVVLDTPDGNFVLERTGEHAYCYRQLDGTDPRKWARCQAEMEDGRFALHQKAPAWR